MWPTKSVLSVIETHRCNRRLRFRVDIRACVCACVLAREYVSPILALHSLAIYFFGLTCLFANHRIRMMIYRNHLYAILQKRREENPQQLGRDLRGFLASPEVESPSPLDRPCRLPQPDLSAYRWCVLPLCIISLKHQQGCQQITFQLRILQYTKTRE